MLIAYTDRGQLCSQHRPERYLCSQHRKDHAVDLQEIMGRVIRRERQERRLTIKELGEKAGLSEIYTGEIERGQKYPSSKVLESIATALELDIADLLELMAEEIRSERQPEAVQAIGFT